MQLAWRLRLLRHQMEALVHSKWYKFHRVVQDCKLSYQHASNGVFTKAQLYSNYLWSVNRRPYNTGTFGDQKRRLLNVFLSLETRSGDLWQKYGWRIAEDMDLPFSTDSEQQAVWDILPSLSSFNRAHDTPKQGRWLSWHAMAKQMIPEYHATKIIFGISHGRERPGRW